MVKQAFVKLTVFIVAGWLFAGCQKDVEQLQESQVPPIVDAGTTQAIQLPAASFTLSGTATTQNGSIVAYLWSLVSGPNVPVIAGPGSRTTAVTGITSGTYIFQLMATDNAGLTGVDTTRITVTASPVQTLTLQPANNIANEIHFAGNDMGYNGSAHDIDLTAGAWTTGGNPLFLRGAFKFDLTTIPVGATILTAKLSLYSNPTPINGDLINANSGTNNTFYIRRITSNWSGATATWQTQPSNTTTNQVTIPHTNLSTLDLVDIDVVNIVRDMQTSNNYGFIMMLQNESPYAIRQFCSSVHSVASKRPKIIITYQ